MFEVLETRENPSGPSIVDPIGLPPVTDPTVPAAPNTTTPTDPAVIQQIIDATIAALTHSY
jgi:hypothetical protein